MVAGNDQHAGSFVYARVFRKSQKQQDNRLTVLQSFVFNGLSFLKTGLTSTTFRSVGKLNVNKIFLNSSVKVSEQLCLFFLKVFGVIFRNVLASFVLRFLNNFSISGKKASLTENDAGLSLSLMKRTLGLFLYFEMVLFTGSSNSLLSIRYEYIPVYSKLHWNFLKT